MYVHKGILRYFLNIVYVVFTEQNVYSHYFWYVDEVTWKI